MEAKTAYLSMLDELHRSFRAETRDLTPEQLYFQAAPEANSIIFLPWHFARTEDGAMHRSFGGTPIWEADGWYEKFGLSSTETGGGFGPEEIAAFRPELSLLMEYFTPVWQFAVEAIKTASDDDLTRVTNPERPNMTVARTIESLLIGHGYWHLGEVRFIKGLQGMPFSR